MKILSRLLVAGLLGFSGNVFAQTSFPPMLNGVARVAILKGESVSTQLAKDEAIIGIGTKLSIQNKTVNQIAIQLEEGEVLLRCIETSFFCLAFKLDATTAAQLKIVLDELRKQNIQGTCDEREPKIAFVPIIRGFLLPGINGELVLLIRLAYIGPGKISTFGPQSVSRIDGGTPVFIAYLQPTCVIAPW